MFSIVIFVPPHATAWCTYITYVWTLEGWLYLAVILDLYSRRVVGWAMSKDIDEKLALDALEMAVGERNPAHGLIHQLAAIVDTYREVAGR
jgi:putative transposase